MDHIRLVTKIENELDKEEKALAENFAISLESSEPELIKVIEEWLEGSEPEFIYHGISLSDIKRKENCSYFRALITMNIIMSEPLIAEGYMEWIAVDKDRGR